MCGECMCWHALRLDEETIVIKSDVSYVLELQNCTLKLVYISSSKV